MVITSVQKNKTLKDTLDIYVDGMFSFSISEADYVSLGLYEKRELTENQLNEIKTSVSMRQAKSHAIRYVSSGVRSGKEVRKKLETFGFRRSIIDSVIIELQAMGYINDRLYAEKYVFDRSKLNPKSKKLLAMELKSKGISDEIITEVLDEWQADDGAVALRLAKRKFGKYDITDAKIIKRIQSFLYHRGYDYEEIMNTINRLKHDE